MKKSIGKYIPAILFFVLFIGASIFSNITGDGQDAKLAAQTALISDLNNQKAIKTAAITKNQEDVLLNASGLNFDRVSKDKIAAEAFLKELFTWSNYKDYIGVRNMLLKTYNVDTNDELVTKFMPDISESLFTTQNLKYENVDMYVIGISGSDYTYFAIATVSAKNARGNEAKGNISLIYTIDSDGNLSNISAYTLVK